MRKGAILIHLKLFESNAITQSSFILSCLKAMQSLIPSFFRFFDKGFREGYEKGKMQGLLEGYHLGLSKGRDIGSEVRRNCTYV